MVQWDPGEYLRFAEERARPFVELMRRVLADDPSFVVDLGCGPGNLTRTLAERWPGATVLGVDSSPEMVEASRAAGETARLRFELADLREWTPPGPVDVLTTNATLQWVPGHLDLLPRLLGMVRPGGWFACQVPGNFGERSHTAITELAARSLWRERLAGSSLERPASAEPAEYLATLQPLASRVDVWETTYFQVLQGEEAVVRWISGTGLRPLLQAVKEVHREELLADYRGLIVDAYPEEEWGTVLPYRRIFMVAQR